MRRLVARACVDVQRVVDLGHLVGRELDVDDGADDAGDATGAVEPASGVGPRQLAVMMVTPTPCFGGERVCAADDLADLLGDLGLAGGVGRRASAS